MRITHHATTVITALILLATVRPGHAQDNETADPLEFFGTLRTGYHAYSNDGYRGKVSEYSVPSSGPEASLKLQGTSRNRYFYLESEVLDQDDQTHFLNLDLSRFLQMDLSYMKFNHFLDHDPLTNQSFVTDIDPNKNNGITIEELKSGNTFMIPSLPFMKFFANFRQYNKKGSRQATTAAKNNNCSSCHLNSANKRIDQSTNDIALGFEGDIKKVTFRYEYAGQNFDEGGKAPTADYTSFYPFPIQGVNPYGDTPDFKKDSHKLSIRSQLPFSSSIFSSYQFGKRTNRDTNEYVDFSSFSGRLSKFFDKFLACDVFYGKYTMDNNIANAYERDIEKGGIDLKTRFFKRTSGVLSYRWEDIDRENFTEEETKKRSYSASLNTRIIKDLRLHLRYKTTHVRDPFTTVNDTYAGDVVMTSLPEKENQFYTSLNWNPAPAFSLNSSLRFTDSKNSKYNLDEDLYEFVISAWYVPFRNTTLTCSFTTFKNDIDTGGPYKTFHVDELFYENMPYENKSNTIYLATTYQATSRLALTGDITFTSSTADFDGQLGNKNLGDYSDLDILQLQASAGFTYLINRNMSVYGNYQYHEYNDREENSFDGKYNLVRFGFNYSF